MRDRQVATSRLSAKTPKTFLTAKTTLGTTKTLSIKLVTKITSFMPTKTSSLDGPGSESAKTTLLSCRRCQRETWRSSWSSSTQDLRFTKEWTASDLTESLKRLRVNFFFAALQILLGTKINSGKGLT
jgi:hypothetical protein